MRILQVINGATLVCSASFFTVNEQGVKLITFLNHLSSPLLITTTPTTNGDGFVEILKSSVLLYLGFLNIRRYVLYLYIETLKQRLDAINQLRVDRALAAMGPAFQQALQSTANVITLSSPR